MKIDEIRALLEKYQLGVCTEEERKTIDEWYESLQLGEEDPLTEEVLGSSLAKIQANLLPVIGRSAEQTRGGEASVISAGRAMAVRRIEKWRWMTAGAAAVVLVFGAAWLLFTARERRNPELVINNGPDSDTTVITSRGETRQIVLSDGSTIQLNAGTAFRYPKRFTHRARAVELLAGEAFFQVVTNPAKPFTVTAGKSHTTVLGTSFNIRVYAQDQAIQVSLLTGKVNVAGEGGMVAAILKPHQFIRINQASGRTETGHFDNEYEVAAWREGGMHFKDASFGDIAFEIGNKFNVQLRNISGKQKWSYTGLFRSGSLQEAIETICQTENLAYLFTDDGILITNKNR
jgi:transmembrane sensor